MSITMTTATAGAAPAISRPTRSVTRTTIGVGVVAAAVTTTAAAAMHAAGAPLDAGGKVPIAAIAQFTFIGAVLGGLLLALLIRRSSVPRRRFIQIAVALTALTCVAPLALGSDAASVLALLATHLIAAAIVVPVLARQITD